MIKTENSNDMFAITYLIKIGVILTTLISYFSLFTTGSIAQSEQSCYMESSSGQIIILNDMCNSQDSPKAKACEGPFDDDGFPLALSSELKYVEKAIANARKQGVWSINDQGVQSALTALLNQMPFPGRIHTLLQEQKQLIKQAIATEDPTEKEKLQKKYAKNSDELLNDECLVNLIQSLHMKFPEPLFYY